MLLNCSPVLTTQNFQTFASLFFKVGLLYPLLFYNDIQITNQEMLIVNIFIQVFVANFQLHLMIKRC